MWVFLLFALNCVWKISLLVESQREIEKLKAEKEGRRELRKKIKLQKAKQQAGIETNSEDEFQPRETPTVNRLLFLSIIY